MSERLSHTAYVRVRYADTDKMGIVYYGKYFEYFEAARTELLRVCGLPYSVIEERGFALPVRAASARYTRGAKYDDLLRIEVSMPEVHGARLEISYRIFTEDDAQPIVEGETTLVFVEQSSGRPCRPPEFFHDAIKHYHKPEVIADDVI
jgi:acyl-CoA thioester hydrolase